MSHFPAKLRPKIEETTFHLRPAKEHDGQGARWVVNRLPDCAEFGTACDTRPLLPITQTHRPVGKTRWTSAAADRGFASGNRTRVTKLTLGGSLTVSNHPCWSDNLQHSAHRNWSGSRDSHPDRRVHNAECCCYTTILMACQAAAGRRRLGPPVGLAPTNTSLQNSSCSC